MFARVTKYKMKSDSVDDAREILEGLKSDIMALPGLRKFINVMNEDGSGYVVSLVDSRDISDASADKVRALWANFSDHLETVPSAEGFEIIAEWDKD